MQTFSIASQTLIFVEACALGVVVGLLYDLTRAFRISCAFGFALTCVADLVFCMLLLMCVFAFAIGVAGGVIRGYILVGIILGMILYFFSISGVVVAGICLTLSSLLFCFKRVAPFFRKLSTCVKGFFDSCGKKLPKIFKI